jgi:hypothetical protein
MSEDGSQVCHMSIASFLLSACPEGLCSVIRLQGMIRIPEKLTSLLFVDSFISDNVYYVSKNKIFLDKIAITFHLFCPQKYKENRALMGLILLISPISAISVLFFQNQPTRGYRCYE